MLSWVLIAVFSVIIILLIAGAGPWHRYFARRHMLGRPRLNSRAFALQFYPENLQIAALVRDILQEYIQVDLSQMQPSDQPVRDFYLGAIYGDEVEDFVMEIEQRFGIRFDDAEAKEMRTVDDIIRQIILKVEET